MYKNRMRRSPFAILVLTALVLLFASCGADEHPTATPQPPAPAPSTPPTPAPADSLIGLDLLTAPGVTIQCDSSEDAEVVCGSADGVQHIQTTLPASGYARWSLRFPATRHPLRGNEILTIHRQSSGNLKTNVYTVEADGTRTFVPMKGFGLARGWQTIHIPLRKFVDGDGKSPDFSAVREIQLAFEWADMQGEFLLDSLGFAAVWEEQIEPVTAISDIHVPDGFVIEAIATDGHNLTQMETPTADSLLVSEQAGRIWWYWDDNGDGFYERRRLYDTGYSEVVGLLYDPLDGAVWINGRGQLWRTQDTDGDGVADVQELRVDGLPWGRHQNNGLEWNPVADPFSGEPAHSWIYFGLGSQGDTNSDDPISATVLRFPRLGRDRNDLQVVSRGNRNAYDVVWAAVDVNGESHWSLFASENGPDFNDAPDEVNHIRWGVHYGFPEQFGLTRDPAQTLPNAGPVAELPGHSSADGLAFVTAADWPAAYRTLYVSLFGEIFGTERVGHTVERIALSPVPNSEPLTFRGETSTFIDGLDRPLAMTTDSQGQLLVADYVTGIVYRVRYVGP
ncbi:MAG: hypothetical protein WAU10_13830 [Caldilineaceae bacterium]